MTTLWHYRDREALNIDQHRAGVRAGHEPKLFMLACFVPFVALYYLTGSSWIHSFVLAWLQLLFPENCIPHKLDSCSINPQNVSQCIIIHWRSLFIGLTQHSAMALQAAITSWDSPVAIQQSQLQPKRGYGSGPGQAVRAQQG